MTKISITGDTVAEIVMQLKTLYKITHGKDPNYLIMGPQAEIRARHENYNYLVHRTDKLFFEGKLRVFLGLTVVLVDKEGIEVGV